MTQIGVDRFPLVPEGHVVGPADDGLEEAGGPAGVVVEFHGQRVAMQGGGEVDDVGVRRAGFDERAVEPGARAFALGGREDVAVVLQVVADDERGSVFAAASAADSLAGAEGLDGDAVVERDAVASPRGADGRRGIVGCERLVFDEFGL